MVGQELITTALINSVSHDRMHHSYLFTGGRGVGKTTLARLIAKALNCLKPEDGDCCGTCEQCLSIERGNHIDVIELDAASNRGVEEVQVLFDQIRYPPSMGRKKVVIIDEVHMLSIHAFNSMLKTLEEPPSHTVFILATTELSKLPKTIVSRCIKFNLQNIPRKKIENHLTQVLEANHVKPDEKAIELITKASGGSLRDALSLAEQAVAISGQNPVGRDMVSKMLGFVSEELLTELLVTVGEDNCSDAFEVVQKINESGASSARVLDQLASFFHEICKDRVLSNCNRSPDNNRFGSFAIDETQANLFYQICTLGKRDLHLAPDEFVGLEMTILRIFAFIPDKNRGTYLHDQNKTKETLKSQGEKELQTDLLSEELNQKKKNDQQNRDLVNLFSEVQPAKWPMFIKKFELKGLVKQFFWQAELLKIVHNNNGSILLLALDNLFFSDNGIRKKAEDFLSNRLNRRIEIKVESKLDKGETLAKIEGDIEKKSNLKASKIIKESKVVKEFLEKFDAEITIDSTKLNKKERN